MGGDSSQSTSGSSTTSSSTSPWGPTQGLLQQIIGSLGGQFGNTTPTSAEQGALGQIQQNAQGMPSFGGQATDLTNQLFSGGTDRSGVLMDAYKQYQNQLSPYANGQNLDPTKAPGMQSLLDTIRGDVSNSVNGMFAGAGRDLSGMNQQTLARGISQGEAAPLLSQYNQNVQNQLGAAGSLYGAGATTTGMLSGLDQTALGNKMQGFNAMNQIGNATNLGPNSVLQAGQMARGLPLSNIGQLMSLILPIAGLGSQSQGQGTMNSTTEYNPSLLSTIGGWTNFAGNIGKLFSDRRLKEDIQQVGELYDGTPVYRFRYIGDECVRIGLMADDVEKVTPECVYLERNGFKSVDYGKATERAAEMAGA